MIIWPRYLLPLCQYMLNCWSTMQPDTREWLINWSSKQKSSSTWIMLIIVAMALEVMALWTGLCLHWRQSYFTTPTGRPSYLPPPCSNIVNPFLTPPTSLSSQMGQLLTNAYIKHKSHFKTSPANRSQICPLWCAIWCYVVLRGDLPSAGPSGPGAWPLPLIHTVPRCALLNLTTLNYCATQHNVRYQRPF